MPQVPKMRSPCNEAAIKSYNQENGTAIAIRQVKYLNNIVEQDPRGVKRITRPMLGFKSFAAAQDTLVGIELMHMMHKAPYGRTFHHHSLEAYVPRLITSPS